MIFHKYILTALLACPLSLTAQNAPEANWASKNIQFAENLRPHTGTCTDTTMYAWRGERLGVQAVIYAPKQTGKLMLRLSELRAGKKVIPAKNTSARFVSYVTTDGFQNCGFHPQHLAPYQVPDVIETDGAQQLGAQTARPVWCTIEVPDHAEPGIYKTKLEVVDSASNKVITRLNLKVNVSKHTLPSPAEQQFHVDFWQQPYAVSRYYGLERWSEAHCEALKPYLRLLARSGQKVVSAILFYEPWGDQSVDKFDPMIQTTKKKDGSWAYDYSVFDKWVELCEECGISKQINCFSMVPWDMSFRYFDEAKHRMVDLKTSTSSKEYKELWESFIRNFAAHLKEKGWYDKTCIAMDERGLSNMLDAYAVAQKAAPGIKMALAGTYHKELVDKLYDYCIAYGEDFSAEELAARKDKGWISTTYTCCSTPEPNIFSNSLPAEAVYLPVYCIANQFKGYLHWSWMNWDSKPLTDSRFRLFAPGDTYCIYPGPRSSVRYERFIEGVALAEKIRLLRAELEAKGQTDTLNKLNSLVKQFEPEGIPEGRTAGEMVDELQRFINQL